MALDKQRILSELGSVVNQLQSADCGCMSKLFNNGAEASHAGMNGSHPSGCRHGCCSGHGHHNCTCAGEPHSRMPCSGCCNPPKLYSETYNYLANNVLPPAMNEVYNDLKSLNATNTIMNDSPPPQNDKIAQNMGMIPGAGNADHPGQRLGHMMASMNNNPENAMQSMDENGMMGPGMGPEIAKMMMSGGRKKPQSDSNEGNQQSEPMKTNGVPGVNPNTNNVEPNSGNTNTGQNMTENPLVQYSMQMGGTPINANDPGGNSMNNTNVGGGPIHSTMSSNPSPLQHNNIPPHTAYNVNVTGHNHNKHTAGVNEFNKAFPSVMQDDLGFDPMAIAVQMNPANKRKAAMETIKNVMMETPHDPRKVLGKLAISQNPYDQSNTMQQPITPHQTYGQSNMSQGQQNILPPTTEYQNLPSNQMPMQNQFPLNQQQQYYAMQQFPTGAGGHSGVSQQLPYMQQFPPGVGGHTGVTQQVPQLQQFPLGAGGHNGVTQQLPHLQQYQTGAGGHNGVAQQLPQMQQYQTGAGGHNGVTQQLSQMQPYQTGAGGHNGVTQQLPQLQQHPINQIPMQNQYQMNQSQQLYPMNTVPPQQLQQRPTNVMPIQNEYQMNQPQPLYPMNTVQPQQLQQQPNNLMPMQNEFQQHQVNPINSVQQQRLLQQQMLDQQREQQLIQQQPPLQQIPLQQRQQVDVNQSPQQEQYGTLDPAQQLQGNNKPYLEPILPSTKSNNLYFTPQTGYNTLGQPVQYVSPQMYRKKDTKLPQTLSPHESLKNANKKYSNVKLTESRTSIVGNNPDHKTPSQNTLQYMYNQYKGSNSYTQQNVSNNVVRGGTASDGKLKVVQESGQPQQAHVERIGGDTILNNQHVGDAANSQAMLSNNNVEQIGDIKADSMKSIQDKPSMPYLIPHKLRNGIQDMVYATANAQAPAWSFHGELQKRYTRTRARPRKYRYY